MEDRENARLPTQEGKRKMRGGVSPGFHVWNKGCELVLYQVSSADMEVTAAAPDSAISLCCH